VINSQTQVTTQIDEELADLSLHHDALDTGTRAGFACVDQDLEALDQRINRHCAECEKTEEELHVAEGRINNLSVLLATQREMIQDLIACVDFMEGKLCYCGKGKAREPLQEISPLLGSPLELGPEVPKDSGSDTSYHMPLIASSSAPSSTSPIVESNKENVMVLYDSRQSLVKIVDRPIENIVPLPVQEPCLDFAGISRLIVVRGQPLVLKVAQSRHSILTLLVVV